MKVFFVYVMIGLLRANENTFVQWQNYDLVHIDHEI